MNNKSDFEKVADFNHKFGAKMYERPDYDIFDKDPKLINLRMSLIREEMRELEDAVKNKDLVETLDALNDLKYVILGMEKCLGFDETAFNLVHESNMTKLCWSETEAQDTVNYYKQHPELGYDSPKYKLSDDGTYYIVVNENTGKILKSINYKPVDLKHYIDNKINN